MAGYVPESMKEIQGLIAKAYADTVLNAFLSAPELLSIAPVTSVSGEMSYDEQLDYLRTVSYTHLLVNLLPFTGMVVSNPISWLYSSISSERCSM